MRSKRHSQTDRDRQRETDRVREAEREREEVWFDQDKGKCRI